MVKVQRYAPQAMQQWTDRLPDICKGFAPKDIFNCDETSIFFQATPQKSLLGHKEQHSGVKVSKDRFSILVCANAEGQKEKLWVIGKAKRPHQGGHVQV